MRKELNAITAIFLSIVMVFVCTNNGVFSAEQSHPTGEYNVLLADENKVEELVAYLKEHGISLKKEIKYGGQVVDWVVTDPSSSKYRILTTFLVFSKGTPEENIQKELRNRSLGFLRNDKKGIAMAFPWLEWTEENVSADEQAEHIKEKIVQLFKQY